VSVIKRAQVAGRWVHSHEEDTDDEMVFRAADSGYAFPPSRGRAGRSSSHGANR